MAKPPAGLGKKIDRFFKLRKERLDLEKKAGKIKVKESDVRDDLIIMMDKAKLTAATEASGTVSITRPEIGRVDDWAALYAWIKRNNAFELLQRRLNQSDLDERYELKPVLAKNGIPGISKVTVVKFHATAKKGK